MRSTTAEAVAPKGGTGEPEKLSPAQTALQQLLNGTDAPGLTGEEQILDFLGDARRDPRSADFLKRLFRACDERTVANVETLLRSVEAWWKPRSRSVGHAQAYRLRLLLILAVQTLAEMATHVVAADMDRAGWFGRRHEYLEAALKAGKGVAAKYLQLSALLSLAGRQSVDRYNAEGGYGSWAETMERLQLRRARIGKDLVYTGGTLEFRMARERRFGPLAQRSAAVEQILDGWGYMDAAPTYERAWRLANGLLLIFALLAVVGWVVFNRSARAWKAREAADACAWIESNDVVRVPAACGVPATAEPKQGSDAADTAGSAPAADSVTALQGGGLPLGASDGK